jgi:hypothetical protein
MRHNMFYTEAPRERLRPIYVSRSAPYDQQLSGIEFDTIGLRFVPKADSQGYPNNKTSFQFNVVHQERTLAKDAIFRSNLSNEIPVSSALDFRIWLRHTKFVAGYHVWRERGANARWYEVVVSLLLDCGHCIFSGMRWAKASASGFKVSVY